MKEKLQNSAFLKEKGFIWSRQFCLLVAAIGSMFANFMLGSHIADIVAPNSFMARLLFSNGLVILVAIAIDWGLGNALSALSDLAGHDDEGEKKEVNNKPLWGYALFAACATITISLCSNYFISQDLSGESPLVAFNKDKQAALLRNDTLKAAVLSQLSAAPEQEAQMKADANKRAKAVIAAAVGTGSEKWQGIYDSHKDDYGKWFWTCTTDCRGKFTRYRDRVRTAHEEAAAIRASATGYTQMVASTVSSTLSYDVSSDSTYTQMRADAFIAENDRKSRQWTIMVLLSVLAFFCVGMAIQLTFILRSHRQTYGQQVVEDHISPILTVMNTIGMFFAGCWDIIHVTATLHTSFRDNDFFMSLLSRKMAGVYTEDETLVYTGDSTDEATEEALARLKVLNKDLSTYKWKLANGKGKAETAIHHINRLTKDIEELRRKYGIKTK